MINDNLLEILIVERMNHGLELSLQTNKAYKNAVQLAEIAYGKLDSLNLNEKQRQAVDNVVSANNYTGVEYGDAAYRLGFKDCLKLISELCQSR